MLRRCKVFAINSSFWSMAAAPLIGYAGEKHSARSVFLSRNALPLLPPLPVWAMVTSLWSYPPSHCRFPVWPQESCFKLVLAPLLWPEVLLILLLLEKLNVHERRQCGRLVAERALSVSGLCEWFVFVPVWCCTSADGDASYCSVSLRMQWRMFQREVCKKLFCLFNQGCFGFFSKQYLKGDGVAVEPISRQKLEMLVKEGCSQWG